MTRGKIIAWFAVAAFFAGGLTLGTVRSFGQKATVGRDELTGIAFNYSHQSSAEAGEPHLIAITIKQNPGPGSVVKSIGMVHSASRSPVPAVSRMQRLELADLWTGAFTAGNPGDKVNFYFVAELDDGRTFTVPPKAVESGERFRFEFNDRPPIALAAFHAVFLAGSALLILHGLYFAVLFLAAKFPDKGGSRHVLHLAELLAGIAVSVYALLVFPAGIILAAQISGGSSSGIWHLGIDQIEARRAAIAVVFACLVLSRTDLIRYRGNPKPLADKVYAVLYLGACILAAIAYMLPLN